MTRPLLELHLHLINGSTHKFVQNDREAVDHILQHIGSKVFAQPSLVIFDEDAVVAYPGSALTGLSVFMEPMPEELVRLMTHSTSEPLDLIEITEGDYQAKKRQAEPFVVGQPFVMVQEIELTSGHRFWLEVHGKTAARKMQERHILHTFFEQPVLPCRCLGGGLSLWNRAHMVSSSFSPKPEVPEAAWPAERVMP